MPRFFLFHFFYKFYILYYILDFQFKMFKLDSQILSMNSCLVGDVEGGVELALQ